MRPLSLSWVLPLVLALSLHHVLASGDADAHTPVQEGEDAASARSKRGLRMLRLGRGLQMLRLGKRGSEMDGSDFDFDPLMFQMLMENSEPLDERYAAGYDGYYAPDASLLSRYRRSLDDDDDTTPYAEEDMADEAFDPEEKRQLGMLRLGKRQGLGMLRLGKRQGLGMLRLGKRQGLGMLRLGKRRMGMLRLGKRRMGMLRLGKRRMGMLRLGKRRMGMLRLGKKDDEYMKEEDKRQLGMLRLGKKDADDTKEEDKRQLGMLRLGKRDVSAVSQQGLDGDMDTLGDDLSQ